MGPKKKRLEGSAEGDDGIVLGEPKGGEERDASIARGGSQKKVIWGVAMRRADEKKKK